MKKIFNLLNSKNKFLKKLMKKIPFLNSSFYHIKKQFIKKVFLHTPPYGHKIHDELITSHWDPVRFGAIALAINTIKKKNIKGHFAELGVFQGLSSKIIHKLAPERKLYLFDTFEGFPIEFLEDKTDIHRFKDTNLEFVKSNIGDLTNVEIKKGIFPETAKGLENEFFSFISLDFDLYKSTRDGLNFFYQRLSKGGYIFVHDYNNPQESDRAVFKAVNDFFKDKPEKIIEIPDINGSAIIRKS